MYTPGGKMNIDKTVAWTTIAFAVLFASQLRGQNQMTLSISDIAPASPVPEKPYTPSAKVTIIVYGRQVEDEFSRTHQGISVINPEALIKYGDLISLGLDFAPIVGTRLKIRFNFIKIVH